MKKKVLIAALFLVAYLGFLLVKLPATLVVRHLPLPHSARLPRLCCDFPVEARLPDLQDRCLYFRLSPVDPIQHRDASTHAHCCFCSLW